MTCLSTLDSLAVLSDWLSDSLLLAQSIPIQRGPGNYLNWLKFVPVVIVYLLWVYTTNWVESDTKELQSKYEFWHPALFFPGLLGIGLAAGIVPLDFYFIQLPLAILGWGVPLLIYIHDRNKRVPEDQMVTFQSVWWALMEKLGIRQREVVEEQIGPPIRFIGKSITQAAEDPDRVRAAEQSKGYMSAKELVYDAIVRRATDIHLEPKKDQVAVRYRIDGILHTAEPFDRITGESVVNVFKVLGAMDIAEKRKPQDGSFAAEMEGRHVDFRAASQGTMEGEKLSLRILDKSMAINRLTDLGMRDKLVDEVRNLVTQPHGMVVAAGPTGSGKTTTLYAALREIDRYTRNIITIEDPIEYHLDNVTQIEINTKAGQTFPSSLRSVLRQDPDVIMIGEIRDEETAQIACQAATTGHMVFTTVHSNDAITALFRLLDLGVEPFLASSALSAVVSQRLVRRLCDHCKEPYKPKPEFLKKANLPAAKIDVFYRPPKLPEKPELICPHCGGTGYRGRTGIFEILVVSDKIRELIKENPSMSAIKAEARKNGMLYLQEDGLRQVIRGVTSVQELMRVIT
jgi:type II secretory ATPase GspE/PulE/Tfp pilus assembly ATPase PilB-like protein